MASGNLNPIKGYNPPQYYTQNIWESVRISGLLSPGYVEISGFERVWGWDIKEGKGAQGYTITYTNKLKCEGELTFYLWTDAHFMAWESFRTLFLYDPTKSATPQAVSISHPSLADLGISRVVTKSIAPIRHVGLELFTCVVKLIEYAPTPAQSAVATPTGTKPDANLNAAPAPSPQDPLQQKIASLFAQLQAP